MKLIFICGSLEAGKDGVGDYTRRLSAELFRQGISVGMLAYNDKHITVKDSSSQKAEGLEIPCLRLPHTWKSKKRSFEAKAWVTHNSPEWLSLQFVPYSFHNKGLPFGLAKQLKKIGGYNVKWNIMFHELWIGMSYQSSNRERLIGKVQKKIIKHIIKKLKPNINTQTSLYQHHLNKMGFKSQILDLFSNIPNFEQNPNVNLEQFNINNDYFVIFGSIYKKAPLENFIKELAVLDKNKTLSFVTLGRNGTELNSWSNVIKKYGFKLNDLGEQTEYNISYILSHAKYGIATTPYHLIQKSGSVAAMRNHKIPVICFSQPWEPIGFTEKYSVNGVLEYIPGNLKNCLDKFKEVRYENKSISDVSEIFLNQINNYG